MISINQGPGKPPYNCIIQPYPGGKVAKGDTVQCTNPQTKKVTVGVCVTHWTFLWTELPDEFGLGAYGVDALTIYKYLQQKPEYADSHYVRFCKLEIKQVCSATQDSRLKTQD
jgi:hypothetical protein